MSDLSRIEAAYGCVAEHNRSREEADARECELRCEAQQQYEKNREKIKNAKVVLWYGGGENCGSCPYADHQTQRDADDDMALVICNAPDDKTDCDTLNYERAPYTHIVVYTDGKREILYGRYKNREVAQHAKRVAETTGTFLTSAYHVPVKELSKWRCNIRELPYALKISPLPDAPSDFDMMLALSEIEAANEQMNFYHQTVSPYGFPVTVESMVEAAKRYDGFTEDSKEVLIAELNGLIRILNCWIEDFNSPKVTIRLLQGPDASMNKTITSKAAKLAVESGLAEYV